MERRNEIGSVLRGESPGRARAPADLRDRVDAALGDSDPGRARVPGGSHRTPTAIGALAVLMAGAAVWVGIGSTPAIEPEAPPVERVAAGAERAGPLSRIRAVALRPDPLTQEAKQIWSELNLFRATVEKPVRTMAELGKSL
ncbi:MAG: hypothetical protein RIB60_06995 [Phycisphaerales bacterium]